MGAPNNITERLLSYEETQTCSNLQSEGTSVIYGNSSYWLGSTYSIYDVWSVDDDDDETLYDAFLSSRAGNKIRPVIEVYTKDIG